MAFHCFISRIQDNWNPLTESSNPGRDRKKEISLQAGGCGNKLLLPLNTDIGVVPMCDRTFKIEGDGVVYTKEQHKRIDTSPSQKELTITFDQSTQIIVQNPITMFITPYDSFGSLYTDNTTSFVYTG